MQGNKVRNDQIRLCAIKFDNSDMRQCFFVLKQSRWFSIRGCLLLIFCSLMIGCGTTQAPAPVVEREIFDASRLATANDGIGADEGKFYIVQKGDTFYSIALTHGIDHVALAEWNNIVDPESIQPGQRIDLLVPTKQAEPTLFALPKLPSTVPSSPSPIAIEADLQPMDFEPRVQVSENLKTQPKAFKLPYSEQNLTRMQHSINPVPVIQPTQTTEQAVRIAVAPTLVETQPANILPHDPKAEWIWPTTGKLQSSFSENAKGVKISGQAGQTVVASASGEVVYSGHGLRGYGNLIIIKHNNTYLSAYAHNSQILVREGESVEKGQKIAEMGSTDADTTQLHFEIRKHGKPVDPLKYLPKEQ